MESGFTPAAATWVQIASFSTGFLCMQGISRWVHRQMPDHPVKCNHTHDEQSTCNSNGSPNTGHERTRSHPKPNTRVGTNGSATEASPLLPNGNKPDRKRKHKDTHALSSIDDMLNHRSMGTLQQEGRRHSMIDVQKQVLSFVKDTKTDCDAAGQCYGYSDPCGQECYKHIGTRTPGVTRHTSILRHSTGALHNHNYFPSIPEQEDESQTQNSRSAPASSLHSATSPMSNSPERIYPHDSDNCSLSSVDCESQHHHHVSNNAYMSIGLQTSIAIAIHKLPEGFMTYATNHANPSLGFAVFLALLIHNITEGFALALPLYLAIGSRTKAMAWATLLGGFTQPLGAGIAALWFHVAGRGGGTPGEAVYGVMFGATGGIMSAVALELFAESLSVSHGRNLCTGFALLGMVIMGISGALTS